MIHGYKATAMDLKCKGHQYRVKYQYFYNGDIKLGTNGFHYSEKLTDTFRYYPFNGKNRYFSCIAGKSIHSPHKSVTDHIVIMDEIIGPELYEIALKHDPHNIKYIFPQTEELCLMAVKLDGLAIEHVNSKTDNVISAAIKQNSLAEKFV